MKEQKIVLLFCIVAAVHVFIFSAGFPFFNNVDEPSHFDLVLKYSHGHVPGGAEPYSRDSSAYLALFSSCAFMGRPEDFPDHQMPPPLWTEPAKKMWQDLAMESAGYQTHLNYELSQTPLYYVAAGCWWHIGQWFGLGTGRLLYWLRFLNIVLVAGLVWLVYVAARLIFPEDLFPRLAPSILLAMMPQTAFYSVGNDILSAVCFGLTFLCLLRWISSEHPPVWLGAATGLAFAATGLAKATNLPFLAVAAAAVLIKTIRGGAPSMRPALAFAATALPPLSAWVTWCKLNYGDFSGSSLKMKMPGFGWTIKPLSQWLDHPIFSPGGLWTYLTGQLNTFWQGEFLWQNESMALPFTALIYTIVSLALIALAVPGMLRGQNRQDFQRHALQLSLACFIAGLGFFAFLSVIYDFHDCPNPSRDHPYFQAGRMILGALIPFLILIACGLNRLLRRFNVKTKFVILGVLVLIMLASEIATDWRIFSSPYNWFHLP